MKFGNIALFKCPFCLEEDAGNVVLDWLAMMGCKDRGSLYYPKPGIICYGRDGTASTPCQHLLNFTIIGGITRKKGLRETETIANIKMDWKHPWYRQQRSGAVDNAIYERAMECLEPTKCWGSMLTSVNYDHCWNLPDDWEFRCIADFNAASCPERLFRHVTEELMREKDTAMV